MFPEYHDVTSRIDEEPTWYTKEGYPRYGYFKPTECNIYADYSTLMLILCQNCHKPMLIGQDYTISDILQIRIDVDQLDPSIYKYHKPGEEMWRPMRSCLYAPHMKDEQGNDIFRTPTLEDLVQNWGFGDPPNHGCIGDTMGSWEYRSVQAWDIRYGKITKPSADNKFNTIVKMGNPARMAHLENYQIVSPWTEGITPNVTEEQIQAVIARATNPNDPIVTAEVDAQEDLVD